MAEQQEHPGRRLVSPRVACEMYAGGVSYMTVRRLIRAGEFPQPVVLSRDRNGKPARVAFVVEELVAWAERKIASRG